MRAEVGFTKPSSRSLGLAFDRANEIVSGDTLLSDQPTGKLRSFLSTSFPSDQEAADAFFLSGGSVVVRTRSGKAPKAVMWVVRDGLPALAFAGGGKGTLVEIKVLIEGSTWS